MFIEDLKNDFYNVLLGNRVLLLVHYDVDAVCACKILQGLFKTDNISYTLVPVGGVSELKKAYEENNEEVKYVVLVNCGGTIDLVDILQPEEDVIFFVLDYHKPTDVCNVYSDGQVRLVYKDTEENIPNFDDIFRDDEDEEEESVGREGAEAVVERRRARRDWEERRNTLMFNYTQFSYYGKPSAVVLVQLARLLSRVEVQTSWCGCVSVATAEESCRRAPAAALLDASELQPLATHPPYSVTVAKTLALPLLTDWSLWSALRHSPRLAPSLRLHRRAGEQRLRALLADMGVPLAQARQAYRAMDVELRAALLQRTEEACGKAALPTPAKAVAVLRRAHASPRSALDAGYALAALLAERQLGAALRALDAHDDAAARAAAAAARRAIESAVNAVTRALAAKAVTLAGPFAFLALSEPLAVEWARLAARWAGAALGGRRAVLLAAPAPRPDAHTLLLGVPPDPTQEPRNLFGAAFEQAAAKSGVSVSLEHFDPSAVTLPTAQRQAFVDALTALLS